MSAQDGDAGPAGLAWEAGFSFVAYDQTIGFRVNRARMLPALRSVCPPGSQLDCQPTEVEKLYSLVEDGPEVRLYEDGESASFEDLDSALEAVRKRVEFHVACESGRKIFVHAGAVEVDGCAVVFPGRTFTGKTTLVQALIEQGARLYSDEFAVFDEQGWLHPFPRRLTIRSREGLRERRATVEELGGVAATTPARVGLVVVTRYREGVAWRPRRLSPGKASLELLANTVAARKYPAQALSIFQQVTTGAVTLKAARPGVESAVASIRRAVRKYWTGDKCP